MKKVHYIFVLMLVIIPGVVYLITISPTVTLIDSGELATVCKTLGIAHPTGYPLYTLLGKLITFLPIGSVVFKTNILSALFSICAIICLYLIVFILLNLYSSENKLENIIIAFTGALIFSFSNTLWSVSVVTEVYSLTTFLGLFLCSLLIQWKKTDSTRTLFLFAFLLGLAFGNHLSIILFVPASIYFVLVSEPRIFKNPMKMGMLLLFFITGLTIYLYLPIRASQAPLMNWGNPVNLEKFFRHISGWQYRVWMFTKTPKQLILDVKDYGILLARQFTPYLLVFIPFGIIYLIKKSKTLLVFFIILFAGNILYTLNYDIPDIEPYFLPSFFVSVIFICTGLKFLLSKVNSRNLKYMALLLPILPLVFNFKPNNYKHRLYEELAKNLLKFPQKNSLIIMDNWDYYSPSIYMQHIEGYRADLTLVDFELLRRSWYVENLLNQHPKVFKPAKEKMEAFLEALKPFERQEKYNPYFLQQSFVDMIYTFVYENLKVRNVYTTFEEKENIFKNFNKIPEGLLYRLSEATDSSGISNYRFINIKDFETKYLFNKSISMDERTESLMTIYTRMWGKRSNYMYKLKKLEEVKEYMEYSCEMDSGNIIYLQNLGVVLIEMEEYREAIQVFQNIADLYPEKRQKIGIVIQDLERKISARTNSPNL